MNRFAAACVALCALATPAHAQRYLVGGAAEVLTGVEGGGGARGLPLQRARTTLRLGGDLSVDEFPKDLLAAAVLVEIEPRSAVGFDLRYARRLGSRVRAGVGGIGYVVPETLLGGSFDVQVHVPLGSRASFTVGPVFNVFALGSDLPDGTMVWQGLLRVGFHATL